MDFMERGCRDKPPRWVGIFPFQIKRCKCPTDITLKVSREKFLETWWSKKDVMIISCPVHPSVSFSTTWNWNYRHLARWYDRNIHCPRPRVSWSRIGSRRYFIGLRNYWIKSHGTTADVCLRAGNTKILYSDEITTERSQNLHDPDR